MKKKQKLGAFYTPETLANPIAAWAIRNVNDKVIEPSFGGCCFLSSTWNRLREIGCKDPFKRLYGADVDPRAFDHLRSKFGIEDTERRFVCDDFLLTPPSSFSRSLFDVVIGNPPYIRNESLSKNKRESYRRRARELGFLIPGKPSAWAYFVLFSLLFLKKNGRMAWVLPWSLLKGVVGEYVLEALTKLFLEINIFPIESELFKGAGTNARTLVLLCDGYKSGVDGGAGVRIWYCHDLSDFEKHLNCTSPQRAAVVTTRNGINNRRAALEKTLARVQVRTAQKRLSDYGKVTIGVVTGDSSRFVLTQDVVNELRIPRLFVSECLLKGSYCNGLIFHKSDFRKISDSGKPSHLLVLPKQGHISALVMKHLRYDLDEEAIRQNRTFSKRDPWYSIQLPSKPHGFIRFFMQEGPLLIINKGVETATNSLYTFRLFSGVRDKKHYMACMSLSVLSSLGQGYAELIATRYGPGALKLDVQDVREIPIHIACDDFQKTTREYLKRADDLVRSGNVVAARKVADEWLCKTGMVLSDIKLLSCCLDDCRKARLGSRSG